MATSDCPGPAWACLMVAPARGVFLISPQSKYGPVQFYPHEPPFPTIRTAMAGPPGPTTPVQPGEKAASEAAVSPGGHCALPLAERLARYTGAVRLYLASVICAAVEPAQRASVMTYSA